MQEVEGRRRRRWGKPATKKYHGMSPKIQEIWTFFCYVSKNQKKNTFLSWGSRGDWFPRTQDGALVVGGGAPLLCHTWNNKTSCMSENNLYVFYPDAYPDAWRTLKKPTNPPQMPTSQRMLMLKNTKIAKQKKKLREEEEEVEGSLQKKICALDQVPFVHKPHIANFIPTDAPADVGDAHGMLEIASIVFRYVSILFSFFHQKRNKVPFLPWRLQKIALTPSEKTEGIYALTCIDNNRRYLQCKDRRYLQCNNRRYSHLDSIMVCPQTSRKFGLFFVMSARIKKKNLGGMRQQGRLISQDTRWGISGRGWCAFTVPHMKQQNIMYVWE